MAAVESNRDPRDVLREREAELPWSHVVLSVVVPAYNEVKTIQSLLRRVREVPLQLEVIVVDDGSRDGTRELLPRLKTGGRVAIIDFRMDSPHGPPRAARVEAERVKAELKRAGYELREEHALLPYQYFLVFAHASR